MPRGRNRLVNGENNWYNESAAGGQNPPPIPATGKGERPVKHYVLLKLKPGADVMEVQHKLWKTYRAMDDELDWLNHPVIYRSSDAIDNRYDLMAIVDLDGEDCLATYRNDPHIVKLNEKLRDLVEEKSSFDHY